MICPDCGGGLDLVALDDVCPGCGGRRRSAVVAAGTGVSVAAGINTSVRVGRQRFPSWPTLWGQINRRVNRLERMYAGTLTIESSGDLEDEVDALLLCVANLRDWMYKDPVVGPRLKKQITALTSQDPLALCHEYANSFKHHTYDPWRKPKRYARINETATGPDHFAVSLRYWWENGGGDEDSEDALAFATKCVAEWRRFFATHGIEDPQPIGTQP